MVCPIRISEQSGNLVEYVEGRLGPEAADALEKHLRLCPQCAQTIESQRQVWSALDAWHAAPVSEDFDAKLYARIESQEAGGLWSRLLHRSFGSSGVQRALLPVAAACVTVFAAILLHVPGYLPLPLHNQSVRSDAVEVEQIDRTLEDLDMLGQLSAPPPAGKQL